MLSVIRRFIFAIVTFPIVVTGYGLLYFGIGLVTPDGYGASVTAFLENLPAIAFGYIVVVTFYSQISRLIERIIEK
jgi:hypothetical protein